LNSTDSFRNDSDFTDSSVSCTDDDDDDESSWVSVETEVTGFIWVSLELTASSLASESPEMQKNMIGEALYPLIQKSEPELAGKITGMFLEMDNSEILCLLESCEALNAKILEAVWVLEEHHKVTGSALRSLYAKVL